MGRGDREQRLLPCVGCGGRDAHHLISLHNKTRTLDEKPRFKYHHHLSKSQPAIFLIFEFFFLFVFFHSAFIEQNSDSDTWDFGQRTDTALRNRNLGTWKSKIPLWEKWKLRLGIGNRKQGGWHGRTSTMAQGIAAGRSGIHGFGTAYPGRYKS